MRIAIMQPYFFPYAGYFRLFAAADLFVVLDTVQFPRRGWVHRNRFRDDNGTLTWLTLPLSKSAQTASIAEQTFRASGEVAVREQITRFPALRQPANEHSLLSLLWDCEGSLVPYLVAQLTAVRDWLGLTTPIRLASDMSPVAEGHGAERLIDIAKACDATQYVNLAGGRELYRADEFERAGLHLEFLTEFQGDYASILERALTEPRDAIKAEVIKQTQIA